jgi:hypothetical protein
MSTFTVWYRDPFKILTFGPSFETELTKLWTEVCEHPASRYKDAKTSKLSGQTLVMASNELLVYLLPSQGDSIIRRVTNQSAPAGVAGFTVFGTGMGNISELYMDRLGNPTKAAKMAFHELMHNKLQKDNTMHSPDVGGAGLADEALVFSNPFAAFLSAENIRLLAPVLHQAAWQFQWPKQNGEQ